VYPGLHPLPPLWSIARRYTYGLLDAVVAQTSGTAEWLRRHTNVRRVEVIPNAVVWPVANHEPIVNPQSVVAAKRKVLLGVGRLEHQKNWPALIKAFAQISARQPLWDLVILGQGGLDAELRALGAKLGLEGRLIMPGRVGNVGAWYDRADLFAMTSHYEGFPNALLEALAHGTPAVAVDCPEGPAEIIVTGRNGVLVPADDERALADALLSLMDSPTLLAEMAGDAASVRGRYSEEAVATMWNQVLGVGVGAPE